MHSFFFFFILFYFNSFIGHVLVTKTDLQCTGQTLNDKLDEPNGVCANGTHEGPMRGAPPL